ncbi:hypothetical protein [Sorangium cellulosum]|uniref:Uncharacterized protein n=1 Tax=Sorangium cellulosum So0157-2 TaxID=1254432 RepID=S4Y471_SORCE|nr:hypothetical protein [Sorangium cellulosum]AGP37723.1 hypothetical protein SCE1572_26535 [Sorangium cellulosum So0157-2]
MTGPRSHDRLKRVSARTPKARACFRSASSGRLVGGFAGGGGRNPNTSSKTTRARRSLVPERPRTHESS